MSNGYHVYTDKRKNEKQNKRENIKDITQGMFVSSGHSAGVIT